MTKCALTPIPGQNSPAGVSYMVNENDSNAGGAVGPEFLGRLFDRHAAALELYARQWCDCSEDVVQEALIELAGQPRTPDDAAAWLYRVVRNKAISALRSARRRKRHETVAAGGRSDVVRAVGGRLDRCPCGCRRLGIASDRTA